MPRASVGLRRGIGCGKDVRQGKLESYQSHAVCLAAVRHVVIDYNGKGMLCCQTRSDCAGHRGAVIGDLSRPGYGLFHLLRLQ